MKPYRAFALITPTLAFTPDCSGEIFTLPNTTLISASLYPTNTTLLLPQVPSCGGAAFNLTTPTSICRVVLDVPTSSTSAVRVEGWLPSPEAWNTRLLASGTGGIGGCVDYAVLQSGALLRFAVFGTNAGHDGAVGCDFFLGRPETVRDFGVRGVHVEVETARRVVGAYYGRRETARYYQGCSTGGRQGVQEAAVFPGDFDGVLVGAPGVEWLRIVASKGILARRVGWPDIGSEGYVGDEVWEEIVRRQVDMFDGADGVVDGIVDEPLRHVFDPAVMACREGMGEGEGEVCLRPEQVESVRRAYEPIRDSEGRVVYPAFGLGADTVPGQDFWRGAVYNSTSWTPHAFNESQMDFAVALNPGGIATDVRNLTAFRARSGKILQYHGRADQTVTPALSAELFEGVRGVTGLTQAEMDGFYRLFFVPGMRHCSGGRGAWDIGQTYPLDGRRLGPRGNALLALVEWVEGGRVVEEVVGAMYGDAQDGVKGEVVAERTLNSNPFRTPLSSNSYQMETSSRHPASRSYDRVANESAPRQVPTYTRHHQTFTYPQVEHRPEPGADHHRYVDGSQATFECLVGGGRGGSNVRKTSTVPWEVDADGDVIMTDAPPLERGDSYMRFGRS
ncbi:feruloyl esterase b precursor [Colletotrichum kahawae]|uniref:Carboxylic ester hydrolase n=1 Tax=Colletotrichum kahawae TaxID=34407 RepID=A0AAE0CWX4_COLKA|nr:feruloyl esterase b precursor [Colletotrichum kahawae]